MADTPHTAPGGYLGLEQVAQVSLLPIAELVATLYARFYHRDTFIWGWAEKRYVGGFTA